MIVWATIIVEQQHERWCAWFNNEPDFRFDGSWPTQALDRLLEASDLEVYDTDQLYPIEDRTRDDHLEFLIRYLGDGTSPP